MRAMIMAAGLGTRLQPLTGLIPKPMVPVLNRPVLHHILRLAARHGICDVVTNLHYFPDSITSYFGGGEEQGVRLRYAYEEELLGTAGGVKNNESFLVAEGAFLVLSGDSLTDVDLDALAEAHRTSGCSVTIALKVMQDPSLYGVAVLDEQGRIQGFQEKPKPGQELSHLCNCGVYIMEPEVLGRFPAHTFYDFGRQLWPEMLAAGERFGAYVVDGYWNDVGDPEAYRAGNWDAAAGLVNVDRVGEEMRPGVFAEAHCHVDDGALVEPPVVMGRDCRIEAGARVLGPVVLGDGCIVEEEALVERTVAWAGLVAGRGTSVSDCILGRATRLRGWVRLNSCLLGDRCILGDIGELSDLPLEPGTVLWG